MGKGWCGVATERGCIRIHYKEGKHVRIGDVIQDALAQGQQTTSDLERLGLSQGFSQRQVLGGIGYLRSRGVIFIGSRISNPSTGRREHVFVINPSASSTSP